MNHFNWAPRTLAIALGWSLVASSLAQTPPSVSGESAPKTAPRESSSETVVLPESVPDPHRARQSHCLCLQQGDHDRDGQTDGQVYQLVVVKPVRTGIGNFGKNITFPGRLINNLLQGKWAGARDETYRFGCNTTVGVAGFFDVASKWKIPQSEADFGQTFGQWG